MKESVHYLGLEHLIVISTLAEEFTMEQITFTVV